MLLQDQFKTLAFAFHFSIVSLSKLISCL